jgi:hypothetical protein
LSQYRWFFVIARNSSFAYKGRALDVKQIAGELGVRYVVEGSVRKAAGRVRVTGQLIDTETGAHLWAQRYDRDYADIFAIQDELTQNVVGAIEPEIVMGEGRRAVYKGTGNLDAYECHMRGMWFHNHQDTAEHFAESISWQRRAIALDPRFARAHMVLARSLYARSMFGYSPPTRITRCASRTLCPSALRRRSMRRNALSTSTRIWRSPTTPLAGHGYSSVISPRRWSRCSPPCGSVRAIR